MIRIAILAALLLALLAGTAHADYLKGDPRKCPAIRPADCAQQSAVWTTKAWMKTHNLVGYVGCTRFQGSLLKWDCSIITGGQTTHVRVWFRATSTGWKRQVTLNP